MSLDHRMEEENQTNLYLPLIRFLNDNQVNRVSDRWNLVNIIVATCYVKPDFDLIMFIAQYSGIIVTHFTTIDNFINNLRNVAGQQYRDIAGISVPLDKLRIELNRINRVLDYYRTTDINSILSDYRQQFGGKKPRFDGSDIQSQSDSVIILSQDTTQLSSQLQALRTEYAALVEENKQNNALLNELRERLNRTENQEQFEQLRGQLKEQIDSCEKKQDDMKRQSTSIITRINDLESDIRKNEETRRQREEKYIHMEEETADLRDKNEELKKQIAELESNKKNLDIEFTRLKTEVLENQKSKEEAEQEFGKIQKNNERLQKQIDVLKSEINGQQKGFASECN